MSFKYTLKDGGQTMIVHDPIYGEIEIKPPFIQIILTKEMQRLQAITQNGFSAHDYPGLKNNERLSHSVGAFYVMSKIVEHIEEELKRYDIFISKDDKDMALCSMLLHDIGHGPFSHTGERIMNYSHEKRTTDILLGDTEVGHLLESIYGKRKLKKIASYIAEIDDEEKVETKNNFTKLLKSLISHQLDADRLDYLVRDSYHAGLKSAINYEDIVKSLGVSVNSNKEYELLVDRKGLTSIETVLIERFQRYRDVYYTRSDGLGEKIFLNIIEEYRKNPDALIVDLPYSFRTFALNPEEISLRDFLEMADYKFIKACNIIKENSTNPLLAYLADIDKAIDDYKEIENTVNVDTIKEKLSSIFNGRDFSKTYSIVAIKSKNKLYKKEESLRINFGNVHKDLSEATPHLIRPEEFLEKNELMFNPEILRLELGMTKEEFEPYREEIRSMLNDLNKKPEEFELKYIMDKRHKIDQDDILNTLIANEFKIVKMKSKENNDEYYDTKEFDLLARKGSLRIRKLTQDGKKKYKATFKMPTSDGEVYSSREEIEVDLDNNSIEELKQKMKERHIDVNLNDVYSLPYLNSVTNRRDIVLEKNRVQVCLSFDNTKYCNHINNEKAEDSMVEIEALGNVEDRVMLNEINDLIKEKFPDLKPNKQSKYERGIKKTMKQKEIKKDNNEMER